MNLFAAPMKAVAMTVLAASMVACGAMAAKQPQTSPRATKWLKRAEASYGVADIEDAELAIENAQRMLPDDPEVRLLASRIALARLDYDRCIELLSGMTSTEARRVRGRAYWYAGALEQAADELDELLADPEVRDPWARDVAKLARSGSGRKPFTKSGALLAVTDMPQTGTPALIVPLEVNGEPALGMIATGVSEAVVDSSGGAQASWISLRFDERVEIRDVPAFAKDLTGLSRQINAPIKVLLGVNLLRHLNPTFDFAGGQFVVRTFEPPPPPYATTVRLDYLNGGGMVIRSAFGLEENAAVASLLVDTSMVLPLTLDEGGWKKAGVAKTSLKPVEGMPNMKQGLLPVLHLGAFKVPEVPGVLDGSVGSLEESLGVNLDGAIGAGLMAAFRVTLTPDSRAMWIEDMPSSTSAEAPEAEVSPEAPSELPLTPPGASSAPPLMPELGPAPLTPVQP